MKIVSVSQEKLALKTLCAGNKASEHLLGRLTIDHFGYDPCINAYRRISNIIANKGRVPSWNEVLEDPVLDSDERSSLAQFKKPIILNKEKSESTLRILEEYRKLRVIFYLQEHIAKELSKPKINVDTLIDSASDKLMSARATTDYSSQLVHIGRKGSLKEALQVIDKTLDPKADIYLPTGFQTFDSKNVGLPRGGLFMGGANTGGFKSAMCLQLAHNMADNGLKVAVVQLEMDKVGIMSRNIANFSKISMNKIINPKTLSAAERKQLRSDFIKRFKTLKRKGGVETYFHPEEDLTMQQVLFLLKPYRFDAIFIDYIGLLAGMDGDDQWRALGKGARQGKVFANATGTLIGIFVQVTDDGIVRYSRTMGEHSSNLFLWTMNQKDRELGLLNIKQGKARNQTPFPFTLKVEADTMTIRDLTSSELKNIIKAKTKGGDDDYYNS